jgi:hypothetical protein
MLKAGGTSGLFMSAFSISQLKVEQRWSSGASKFSIKEKIGTSFFRWNPFNKMLCGWSAAHWRSRRSFIQFTTPTRGHLLRASSSRAAAWADVAGEWPGVFFRWGVWPEFSMRALPLLVHASRPGWRELVWPVVGAGYAFSRPGSLN